MMQNQELYNKLTDFPLEETGGELKFIHRLCRENGWTPGQGQRAIAEYKKFLYLAMISPDPVTPPIIVDQVWHLHLVYTRSYWEDLCGKTLCRPLHHGPTEGGEDEDEKFNNWYEQTMALYALEFGEWPPKDIWPAAAIRFDPAQRWKWIDASKWWMLPKTRWNFGLASFAFAPAMMTGAIFPALIIVGVGLVVFLVIQGTMSSLESRKKAKGEGGDASFDFFDGGSSDSSSCGDSGGGDCGGGCSSGCGGGGCGGGGD